MKIRNRMAENREKMRASIKSQGYTMVDGGVSEDKIIQNNKVNVVQENKTETKTKQTSNTFLGGIGSRLEDERQRKRKLRERRPTRTTKKKGSERRKTNGEQQAFVGLHDAFGGL